MMELITINTAFYKSIQFKVAAIVVITAVVVLLFTYLNSYIFLFSYARENIDHQSRVVFDYTLSRLGLKCFDLPEDNPQYYAHTNNKIELDNIRRLANLHSIYMVKLADEKAVYLLNSTSESSNNNNYHSIGDEVDEYALSYALEALGGNVVASDKILYTGNTYVFVCFYPVYDINKNLQGAIGMEFNASSLNKFRKETLLYCLPLIIFALIILTRLYIEFFNKTIDKLVVKLVYTDNLTGMKNRLAYENELNKLNNRIKNDSVKNYNISIVMYDLNDLKFVNDTLGHLAGDKYISSSASMIRECFDSLGVTYRIGGDEFITIIKNHSIDDVKNAVNKLYSLQNHFNLTESGNPFFMGIALGFDTLIKGTDLNLTTVIKRADEKMYKEKKNKKRLNERAPR